MRVFKNYKDEDCLLSEEQEEHIISSHPEAKPELISTCLMQPLEIRRSSVHGIAQLYYISKEIQRYFCVVVKCCPDGNFISTAYTTTKIKSGEIIYQREV